MIHGIGIDIVAVNRMTNYWHRHGKRALEKILGPNEREACRSDHNPPLFLAKSFAAKEALSKALGTGVRPPVALVDITISHDELGKPNFIFSLSLATYLAERGMTAHLSISDEQDYVVAFVILEKI